MNGKYQANKQRKFGADYLITGNALTKKDNEILQKYADNHVTNCYIPIMKRFLKITIKLIIKFIYLSINLVIDFIVIQLFLIIPTVVYKLILILYFLFLYVL